jgi:hypothetical protein
MCFPYETHVIDLSFSDIYDLLVQLHDRFLFSTWPIFLFANRTHTHTYFVSIHLLRKEFVGHDVSRRLFIGNNRTRHAFRSGRCCLFVLDVWFGVLFFYLCRIYARRSISVFSLHIINWARPSMIQRRPLSISFLMLKKHHVSI